MEPLTDEELAELERLVGEASPAPWIACYGPIGGPDFIQITQDDDSQPDMYVYHEDRTAPVAELEFIATARNYMERLLAEVREHRSG